MMTTTHTSSRFLLRRDLRDDLSFFGEEKGALFFFTGVGSTAAVVASTPVF